MFRPKHPNLHPPVPATFLRCDVLPQLEEVEITGCHVVLSTHGIQGGMGHGDCDTCHWQDVLLCFGTHNFDSGMRCSLSRRLGNTIVPWDRYAY